MSPHRRAPGGRPHDHTASSMATREQIDESQNAQKSTAAQHRPHPLQRPEARPAGRAARPPRRGPGRLPGRGRRLVRRLAAQVPHPRRADRPRRPRLLAAPAHRRLRVVAPRKLADDAGRAFDIEVAGRVDRAVARLERRAAGRPDAAGVARRRARPPARLLGRAGRGPGRPGPAGWDQPLYHQRLMLLLGHRTDAVPLEAGPVPRASARLLPAHVPAVGGKVVPLAEADARAAFEEVRRTVESEVARLRDLREQAPRPGRAAAAGDRGRRRPTRRRRRMLRAPLRDGPRAVPTLGDPPAPGAGEVRRRPRPTRPRTSPSAQPEPAPAPPSEAVAAPAGPQAAGKIEATRDSSCTCGKLASVGAAARSGRRPTAPSGSPGRPGRPSGADPGPQRAPKRS